MFSLFRRRSDFDDRKKEKFAEAIATLLSAQVIASGWKTSNVTVAPRALGYIYGFIDAALRTIGEDMADTAVGVPVTFHVLRGLFPGQEQDCLNVLLDKLGTDKIVMAAVQHGGQQYLDFDNGKLAAPMGLARILLASA